VKRKLNLLVPGPHSRLERTKQLQQQIHCDTIYLTKGSGGAALVSPEDTTEYKPTSPVVVADTVGAGDAFTAVAILGIARGWSHNISLLRAMQFAEKICGIKGALFHNKTVYEDFLQECEQ
jgi:fructokinase